MVYNLAIDADSLIYKSAYRHQNPFNKELAYFEFCQEIGKIRSAIFDGLIEYNKGDDVNIVIVLSPRKSFRNTIYPDYKANRKSPTIEGIKVVKLMIMDRLRDWVVLERDVEADDIVNWYAREHNYFVAAIDKDVINANPTNCYDYNKFKWSIPKSDIEIELWYLKQALMGDSTDNIKGAKGIGVAGAEKIITEMNFSPDFETIVPYFIDREDAIMNTWLVRMDQWDGKKINLSNY